MPERVLIFFALLLSFALLPCMAESKSNQNATESLYQSRCSLCHGKDGRGKTTLGQQLKAADLHSAEVQQNSNVLLNHAILHGKGNMPPFEGQLTKEQVNQLVKYVRQFGKNEKK